ncbi:hypothetical protein K492DRAFT_208838 [Lichtheimia hyalospora FSU 10163]|nr:hypothetical protein K492DRAFT_208838 [Lichtheimia hyalospora FSU 10163]
MIALLILNNSGDVIYQSTFSTQQQPNEANIIRLFLPLLVSKDLLKANYHDRIHYVHHRNKTIAFWEKHGLLYLMWTKRGTVPADMLQHHLHIIDRLLHFQFGPHWYDKVEGITTSSTRPLRWRESLTISHTDIATCLSRLPFLMVAAPLLPRLYSPEMLCCVEQVELQDDLRLRLEECLKESCDTAFGNHQNTSSRFVSFFATPPSSRRVLNLSPLMRHYQHTENHHHHYQWTDALLFARDKLVLRCSKSNNQDDLLESTLPSDALLFLKNMAFEYAEQAAAREDIAEQRMSRPSASSSKSHDTIETSYDDDDNGPTPQPSSSEATSQKSSVTYVYDSSSVSAPFKIREKSTSSVTVASSNCSTPSLSWSSPPILMHNQLLSRLSRKSLDYDDRPLPELRRWSSLTRPTTTVSASQPPPPHSSTTDLLPSDQLPPNATIFHHPSTDSLDEKPLDGALPSSLPLESGFDYANRPTLRQSAPSSPASRSRSPSNADRLSARTSLRNMFSTFLQGEQHQQQQYTTEDDITPQHEGKVMSRWIKWKHQHHMTLCVILLVHLGDGLCATIIFKDDHEKQQRQSNTHHHHHHHLDDILPDRMTNHTAVKTLRTTLQDQLKDFSSFLLTKETTHFSILSFITSYPGLLHFIHIRHGSMLSPRIVDLTYLNQDHDLILEMGEKYQEWVSCSEKAPRWGWPSVTRLEQLSEEMVKVAKASSVTTTAEYQVHQLPGHPGFQCAFRRAKDNSGEYLMAMYFSFIPEAVVLDMHHRLFHDVGQRLLDQ